MGGEHRNTTYTTAGRVVTAGKLELVGDGTV